jgi:hypothetical protein
MQVTGNWKCSATGGCHTGGAQPAIDNNSATTTYNNLVAYKIQNKGYIVPGSTDPTLSTFECNISPAPGTCGAERMPKPDNTINPIQATAAEISKVDTWIKCGSPNN